MKTFSIWMQYKSEHKLLDTQSEFNFPTGLVGKDKKAVMK